MKTRSGIYVPVEGDPQCISFKVSDLNKILECEYTDHLTVHLAFFFNYQLGLFCDDLAINKNLPVNNLASILIKDQKIYGPCLIYDDNQPISLHDLENLITVCKIIPNRFWHPPREPSERKTEWELTYREEERERIWDLVKDFYHLRNN